MFLFLVEFAFANYYYPVTERGAIHGSSFGWETSMFLFLVEFAFANYHYLVTEWGDVHGSSNA